ncbi:MAG: adenine phosphoribosyltransferase [Myxococcales bacterium]|nr:adenine phosphoribosyltransferase [Myxococcales bacterium]
MSIDALRAHIRDVPDFPKPGIVFKDITPLLGDAAGFGSCIRLLTELVRPFAPDTVVAIESRGFIFGAPVAAALGIGFVPVRKPGKLPYQTRSVRYDLEYGSGTLEVHADALRPGQRVMVIDDVLATGGTAAATAQLIEEHGASVCAMSFVVELGFLGGRARLGSHEILSLLRY